MLEEINNDYDNLVQFILRLKGKIVVMGVGKSGHIGKKLAATFSSTGTPSVFIHPTEASHGDMGLIEKNDLILMLSASGSTQELLDSINFANREHIPIASITKNSDSFLSKNSKFPLFIPQIPEACTNNLAPTTSTLCQLALGDALAVAVQKAKNFLPSEFKAFHPGGKLGSLLANVTDIMFKGDMVPLISPQSNLKDAILEMTAKEMGCCGIQEDNNGKLVGIITDGDLRRMIDDIAENLESPVELFMNKKFCFIEPYSSANEALEYLGKNNIPNTFVLDENKKPLGIIHIKQLT